MQRRDFIKMGSMVALAAPAVGAVETFSGFSSEEGKWVDFSLDGLRLSPKEYTALLMKLADEGKIIPDSYSNGGVVEELENKFAKLLGKDSAVFMPTGTLANASLPELTGA